MSRHTPAARRSGWLIGCGIVGTIGVLAFLGVGFFIHAIYTQIQSCPAGGCSASPQEIASNHAVAEKEREAALGGPPPSNCGDQPVPVHQEVGGTIWDSTAPSQGVSIGKAPVWLQIAGMRLEGGKAVLHLAANGGGYGKTADGFPILLFWIMDGAFTGTISVRLVDSRTGEEAKLTPALNNLYPSDEPSVSYGNIPPYRLFGARGHVHSPSCYEAQASSQSDTWTAAFAVGI
jgi:hypothetical protein